MRVALAVVAGVCLLLGVAFAREAWIDYRVWVAYRPIDGTILSREAVEEAPTTEQQENSTRRPVTHYPVRVSVSFGYQVDGNSYVGHDSRFLEKGDPEINATLDAHAPGSRHQCWYDPEQPGRRAVLFRKGLSVGTALGTLFCLLGAGTSLFIFRMLGDRGVKGQRVSS